MPRALQRTGPHTLRHTSSTLRLRATGDLKTTSRILGHTTTRTTERYAHLTDSDMLASNADGSPVDKLLSTKHRRKLDSRRRV